MNRNAVTVPDLDHDAMMLKEFGRTVSFKGRAQRRVVAALIAHMAEKGFPLQYVDGDDDGAIAVTTTKEAMEIIFNLDESWIGFAAPDGHAYRVYLVLWNDPDEIVSDWTFSRGDHDNFSKAMDSFQAEDYA